jgi:threonine synthase
MTAPAGYRCPECAASFAALATPRYRCDGCGSEALDVELDLEAVGARCRPADIAASGDASLWRYAPLLPVDPPGADAGPLRSLGMTPLHAAPRVSARIGATAWIKDDGALPTGSLKDRASAVVTLRARALGAGRIIAASTGNAGVALAAMARAAGITATVLVPASAPPAKIAQLLVFGAELYLVRGSYDDAFALSREASRELGIYCRNTAYNPFTIEGKKTVAFEICEQLTRALGEPRPGRWRAPDRIYVSVGDGNIISGVHKGLRELLALGWIERMPKLIGVQAEGSAAIARAFQAGASEVAPVKASTVADSISADRPADGKRALAAARQTGGSFVVVDDEAIVASIVQLGRDAAVFAEPAAAAAYAGLLQHAADGAIGAEEQVVLLITGNGLKDVAAATRAAGSAPTVEPTLESLQRALARQEKR